MAVSMLALKKNAVKAGMDQAEARKAGREALERFLKKNANGSKGKAKGKAAAKKVVAKKKGGNSTSAKRGRPAKKQSGRKPAARKSSNGKVGRATIGKIKWNVKSDDWNPRPTSGTGIIFAALKSNKGDVDATYKDLKGKLATLVPSKTRTGRKRSKDEQRDDLKYRINRTKWDYAMRTGQHDAGTNRTEYGTGRYAQATKKAQRAAKRGTTTKKRKNKRK